MQLSNHLGNVLSVISDQKLPELGSYSTIEFYYAEVVSFTDNYPFGSEMTERSWQNEYRYSFNGKERDRENTSGSYDFGARILDTRLGRWLSVDAHFQTSPMSSTYAFAANNPIVFLDPNGKENIIFLILTDKGKSELLKKGISGEMIVEQTNKYFESLGLETRVQLVSGKPTEFDICSMDHHDAVAVVGADADNVGGFIHNELDPEFAKNHLGYNNEGYPDKFNGGKDPNSPNPERSENNELEWGGDFHAGEIIALSADAFDPYMQKVGLDAKREKDEPIKEFVVRERQSRVSVISFLIVHGAGHTAGQNHSGKIDEYKRATGGPIMGDGHGDMKASLEMYGSLANFMKPDLNPTYVNAMKERFGTNVAKDNRSNPDSEKLKNCPTP